MASVHDVAAFILAEKGRMTTWKLQKLIYYAQAWHLAWTDRPLFGARIEAWANGPVVPELFRLHRSAFEVSSWKKGDASNLSPREEQTVSKVLSFYGDRSPQWLSDLTHAERPWQEARRGIPPGELSSAEITKASMAEFYSHLR